MTNPTVLLAPRITADSVRVWDAATQMNWPVRRLPSWRVPEGMFADTTDFAIYAEPLFAEGEGEFMRESTVRPRSHFGLPVQLRFGPDRSRKLELVIRESRLVR